MRDEPTRGGAAAVAEAIEPVAGLEPRLAWRRLGAGPSPSAFADDVRAGLGASPKRLPPKYFYDELGSILFEAITRLPEYGLTRAEHEILTRHAGEIAAALPGPVRLVELGNGDSGKTRLLIEALLARQGELHYLPVDISPTALAAASDRLLGVYPGLTITAVVADYHEALGALRSERRPGERTLVLFLGSTIGNLDPPDQRDLLTDVRDLLTPGEGFLLGTDLRKPESVLIPAYDDPLGVTAAFNLNLLARINRELGGAFDLRSFHHLARWDGEQGRVEMHLESLKDQTVPIRALGIEVPFASGETVQTESSYKFTLEQVAELAQGAGFAVARSFLDSGRAFASSLLVGR